MCMRTKWSLGRCIYLSTSHTWISGSSALPCSYANCIAYRITCVWEYVDVRGECELVLMLLGPQARSLLSIIPTKALPTSTYLTLMLMLSSRSILRCTHISSPTNPLSLSLARSYDMPQFHHSWLV